jgi:DnaK suppressor protein
MDQDRARSLLIAERDEVQRLLKETETAGQDDRVAEVESEAEDNADAALALTEEGEDDAIAESMRDRLDAIERALHRLDEGTYGRSIRSGEPIPDERLEADPAAELTVEEARAAERALPRPASPTRLSLVPGRWRTVPVLAGTTAPSTRKPERAAQVEKPRKGQMLRQGAA